MTTTPKPKCKAHKKDGSPCGRWPLRGSTVCPKHGGSAPQVRKRAQERIIAAADLAAARLIEFMNDKKVPYNVRLAATRDLLDRSIGPATQTVKLGLAQEDPWADLLSEVLSDDQILTTTGPRRALPSGRGDSDDDEDIDYDRAQQDQDDEEERIELSFDTPGTIRGHVVRDYGTAATPQRNPLIPPKHIRDGLRLDDLNESGGSARADFGS